MSRATRLLDMLIKCVRFGARARLEHSMNEKAPLARAITRNGLLPRVDDAEGLFRSCCPVTFVTLSESEEGVRLASLRSAEWL